MKIKIKKKVRGEGSGEMCTKNGSYCREKEKKVGGGGGGGRGGSRKMRMKK